MSGRERTSITPSEARSAGGRRLPLSLRRPWVVLAVAALVVAVLAVLGRGVEDELRPTSLSVPGTESRRATEMAERYFGDTAPFAILLQGPPRALDRQGPALIRVLRRRPGVSTISPWDKGSVQRLRPGPRRALILVDFHVDAETAVKDTVPYLNGTLDRTISPPVTAAQTGFASLSRAIQDESVDSTDRAELIALPFLLVVLLLVFRSPVAAAIPLVFGAVTVTASRGVLALGAGWIPIDGFALTVCSMMGLALGVDYSLLMVSRFREELAAGAAPREAARMTRRTAGRTTAFAGSTLLLAMLVTLFVMPGNLLVSLAGTAITVTAIAVLVAGLVGPALLVVLGADVDRWRVGRAAAEGTGVVALVRGALRRPLVAALLIGALVLALAGPALALRTGPPSARQLPESNPARQEARLIADAIGPGWDAPFVVIAVSDEGPITDPRDLAALSRWQRRIAADPGVQAVIGPAQVRRRALPLRRNGNDLLAGRGDLNPGELQKLGRRLGRAARGVGEVRSGLRSASYGAGLLATGSGRAGEGARQLEGGIARAAAGAAEAVEAVGRLADGSERLAAGAERLAEGSGRLTEGQREAQLGSLALEGDASEVTTRVRDQALEEARDLRAALKAKASEEPGLEEQARESERLVEALAIARNDAQRLETTAKQLHSGQERLTEGSEKLGKGLEQLRDGAERLRKGAGRLDEAASGLPGGLATLEGGASQLVGGLEQLQGGAGALEDKLARGFSESEPLESGLRGANVRVSVSADEAERKVGRLRRSSPGIFDSGYFVLSAIQGARAEGRERASHVVDLEHGGQAAQMVVIPRYTFNTPGSEALNTRLKGDAAALGLASGSATGVTGGAAQLIDYADVISQRIPIVIAVITLATFLILVVILRAIPLALIAVLLNLATVAVAFGVLTLLFDVPSGWPLGGHDYVDAIGAAGIFGIVFGLSIDYAVFLLMRMREHHENNASNREAIVFGVERTARVVTGAAAVMLAVFVAFAGADIATVSQLGTGLAVAVLLDATVIRIVLLPALMLLLGERVWWLPRSLARVLPRIDLHGSRAG